MVNIPVEELYADTLAGDAEHDALEYGLPASAEQEAPLIPVVTTKKLDTVNFLYPGMSDTLIVVPEPRL